MTPRGAALARRMVAMRDRARGAFLQRFMKTGPGEYGEGDQLLGLSVPALRAIVREHRDLPLGDVATLLKSPWHEIRAVALLILVHQYPRADRRTQRTIYTLYIHYTRYINNWDLVDCSAAQVVGAHLAGRSRAPLRRLARSRLLWDRRIAMIATAHYIKQHEFDDALAIAKMLLGDDHDLIHKAVGWMLREVGNRDQAVLERFLKSHAPQMPRTALRYAIEKFPEALRQRYLSTSR